MMLRCNSCIVPERGMKMKIIKPIQFMKALKGTAHAMTGVTIRTRMTSCMTNGMLTRFGGLASIVGTAIVALTCASGALASTDAPAHGSFSWRGLEGFYRFGNCQNNGAPYWAVAPGVSHLLLSTNPFNDEAPAPDTLILVRVRDDESPLAVNWNLDWINHGPQRIHDPKTGKQVEVTESYTTAQGLYNSMSWDFGDDSGWATIELKVDAQGGLSYVMNRFHSGKLQTESCSLIRR